MSVDSNHPTCTCLSWFRCSIWYHHTYTSFCSLDYLLVLAFWHCLAIALFIYNRGVTDCTSWKFYMTTSTLNCSSGVPQGSVLCPILFSINVSPVYHIAQSFTISHQQHANDILLYIALSASQPHSGIHIIYLLNYQPKAVQGKWNAKISWSW